MRRREFVALLGTAAWTWPLAAGAQKPTPVIGYLGNESPNLFASRLDAFRRCPSATGYDAVQHRMPAVHSSREFAFSGGSLSYGGSFVQSHTQAGVYTGRILKGDSRPTRRSNRSQAWSWS